MFIFVLFFLLSLAVCHQEADAEYWNEIGQLNLDKKLKQYSRMRERQRPKNIILFVGSGLGSSTLTFGMLYKAEKMNRTGRYADKPLFFDTFQNNGIVRTSSLSSHTTSSEAGMMAIMTGRKVENGKIGTRPGRAADCKEENSIHTENIAELAVKLKRKEVGLVTNMRLSHPTSAAVFGRGIDTSGEFKGEGTCFGKDLASQLLDFPANKFKVLMGGGAKTLVHINGENGTRTDSKNIMEMWKNLTENRTLIVGREALEKYRPDGNKLLGIMGLCNLQAWARQQQQKRLTDGRLIEMMEKAISAMETRNKKGYLLVVNVGSVGAALDSNKARLAGEEILELEKAVKKARQMTYSNETLILLTAHSSHTIILPGYKDKNKSLFEGITFNPRKPFNGETGPGIVFLSGQGGRRPYNYTTQEANDLEFVSPAIYTTEIGNNGADDVPIYADGPYSWLFTGAMENTEIAFRLKYLMCLSGEECEEKGKEGNEQNRSGDKKTVIIFIAGILMTISIFLNCAFLCMKKLKTKQMKLTTAP